MQAPILSRRAQRDLRQIRSYVGEQSGFERANELIDRVLAVCTLFAGQPMAGRPHPELGAGVRSCNCGTYIAFYRPRGATVEILRVIHGRRDILAAWDERNTLS